ncbi:MAG TPA: DUF4270 family protein [Ignavibacteriales bacterium]|nr:DUF4270 family protein [Ignavibacteriales bacterium]
MRKIALNIFVVSALSFLIFACSDDPSPLGSDIIPDILELDTLDSYTANLTQSSSYYKTVVDLGLSDNLMLGKKDNVESSFIQDFYLTLEDTTESDLLDDEIQVLSATLTLPITYAYGDKNAPFDFSMHAVQSKWGITKFNLDSLNAANIEYGVDMKLSFTAVDTQLTVNLNTDVVKRMMKSYADTSLADKIYGIYFKPSASSNKIVGFQAYSTTADYNSSLQVIIQKSGSYIDTLTFGPRSDTHILNAQAPAPNNQEVLYLQGGIAVNSNIKFDLSSLPKNVAINRAVLELYIDSTSSIIGTPGPSTYLIGTMFIKNWNTNELDSNTAPVYITRSGYTISGNIGSIVQRWTTGGETNSGVNLFIYNQRSYLDKLVIYGSAAADPLKRPRLTIYYSGRK